MPTAPIAGHARRQFLANLALLMERFLGYPPGSKGGINALARRVGISTGNIDRWKHRDTSATLDMVERIADAFGLEPWQILAPRLGADLARITEILTAPVMHLPELPTGEQSGLHRTEEQKHRHATRPRSIKAGTIDARGKKRRSSP